MRKRKVLQGDGLDHFFEMHGRRGDTVYRRKRNGELEEYDYVYHPPSAGSPLKDRTIVINRFANSISNPQYKGYSAVLRQLYHYLPYFIVPGSYELKGETVFFIRQSGNYEVSVLTIAGGSELARGFSWVQRICRRTMVQLRFDQPGEYEVLLRRDGAEHSRRRIIVLEAGSDIQAAYTEYLEEFLIDILEQPEPRYARLRIYRRGLLPKTTALLGVSGTYRGQIYYWHEGSKVTFLRANYDHSGNSQTQRFKLKKAEAVAAWKAESEEFKREFEKQFGQWYLMNMRRLGRMMTAFMWYVSCYLATPEMRLIDLCRHSGGG
jgi:hypothetical protein